jgi:4a-hydroxytetrahydrobiopterin dehydratase
MACELKDKHCSACSGDEPALSGDDLKSLADNIEDQWNVVDEHHLERTFTFEDFKEALAFTNQVGDVAEEEQHHPDIALSYGKVVVTVWTHKVDGLTENDFIFAAKVDDLV